MRRRSAILAALAVLLFAGGAAGAVLWPRASKGRSPHGATAAPRAAAAPSADSAAAVALSAPATGVVASASDAGDGTAHSYTRAFLLAQLQSSRDSLRRSLRTIDGALADARDPSLRGAACTRANAAYVGVLLQRTGILFARNKLHDSLEAGMSHELDSLVQRADAVPAALGQVGCSP